MPQVAASKSETANEPDCRSVNAVYLFWAKDSCCCSDSVTEQMSDQATDSTCWQDYATASCVELAVTSRPTETSWATVTYSDGASVNCSEVRVDSGLGSSNAEM